MINYSYRKDLETFLSDATFVITRTMTVQYRVESWNLRQAFRSFNNIYFILHCIFC
jgi:hypothetical protein